MKKSVKITLIVAAVLVGLGLCIAVVGALMGGRISDLRNTYYDGREWHHGDALDGSYTGGEIRVPAEDITALSIDWVAGDVKIMVTDGEEIYRRNTLCCWRQITRCASGTVTTFGGSTCRRRT